MKHLLALTLALALSGCAEWTTHTPMEKDGKQVDCAMKHRAAFLVFYMGYAYKGCSTRKMEAMGWTKVEAK